MLIVGEKLNTSRKAVAEAVERRDADYLAAQAKAQVEAGADYVDVNAGTFLEREAESLAWMTETVQKAVDVPLCLDSPSPQALQAALAVHQGRPLINSISLEAERLDALLPIVTGHDCRVVALCMAKASMPTTVDERVQAADELIARLTDAGVSPGDIFVDPLVQPVAVDTKMGQAALGAIGRIAEDHPGVGTICGLSNVSYGLPHRRLLNRNFLALALDHGLAAAILDPTDQELMATMLSVELLLDRDEYCQNYIDAHTKGRLGP